MKFELIEPDMTFNLIEIWINRRVLDELFGKKPEPTLPINSSIRTNNWLKNENIEKVKKQELPTVTQSIINTVVEPKSIPEVENNGDNKAVVISPHEIKEKEIVVKPNIIEEKFSSVGSMLTHVENKIEKKLNTQVNKLCMDLNQLSFASIDLLLTSLPKPDVRDEFKYTRVMIDSIHKYIKLDLIEGGEDK
jgi:hypothetical protein